MPEDTSHTMNFSSSKLPLSSPADTLKPALLTSYISLFVLVLCCTAYVPARAQNKGTPGKFDFYVLDMPWGPRFCDIKDVSASCKPQTGFVLHGLWPQFANGSWPVFCSDDHGPTDLARNLDLTPDMQLLQHEWDKHGTCSAVGPARFFDMERQAFRAVKVPAEMQEVRTPVTLTPEWIRRSFEFANPSFPEGSFVLSCKDGKLTAVEACFSKDLKAVACQGLHSCEAQVLTLEPSKP